MNSVASSGSTQQSLAVFSNSNMENGATETERALKSPMQPSHSTSYPSPPIPQTPFEKYSRVVEANPLDFNSWVQLLAIVESDSTISRVDANNTFDKFLLEFPLCFGYWNKYALCQLNMVKSENSSVSPQQAHENCVAIFERGVKAVGTSVDMWMKYLEYTIDRGLVTVDFGRSLFQRATRACGGDSLAGSIWEKYILYETMNNDMVQLNSVFKQALQQPITTIEDVWEKYNHFVLAQQLQILATSSELKELSADGDEMDEGMLRVKVVQRVEEYKNISLHSLKLRQEFESRIDRTYYHVTPVTDVSLKNWHDYLDFEERQGNTTKIASLYEKCLIVCANYEEIWLRYVAFAEDNLGFEKANEIFVRAVFTFLKYRASIYLEYAEFLESHDDNVTAKEMYLTVLNKVAPQLVEALVKYCNFERRQKNFDTVKAWYEKGLEMTKNVHDSYVYLVIEYASFLFKIKNELDQAREVYHTALQNISKSLPLWQHYIHFEMAVNDNDFSNRIESIFDRAVCDSSDLTIHEKNDLWFLYVEFMRSHCVSMKKIKIIEKKEVIWKKKNKVSPYRTISTLKAFPDEVSSGNKRSRFDTAYTAPYYAQGYQAYQSPATGYGQTAYSAQFGSTYYSPQQ